MSFVPTKIITLGILPGFISSTIRYNWAIVAPLKAICVVTHEVPQIRQHSDQAVSQYQMRCPRVVVAAGFTAGLQVARLKQAPRICLRNSREIIFQLIILLHVYYARHFLRWHLPYFPLWDSRAPHECCHVTYPLYDHGLGRVALCPYRQSFHRVQSPRNLAHSCWRPVVQLSLSASSLSVPRRGHPRCH